jgi:hypothetical protein
MLSAIEAPAQQGTSLIYGASFLSEINARAIRRCSQQKYLTPIPGGGDPEVIRLDIVPSIRMQKEPLISTAAFRTAGARHFGLSSRGQTIF